jgi:hypothetical protein
VIDLGAGHSSASETLCGRVIAALKAEALLNESVGAGYIERNWPPAFKESGAWPLASLRQSFLNGALTRLLDPNGVLKTKIVEFVARGDFGLACGPKPEGGYERLWYAKALRLLCAPEATRQEDHAAEVRGDRRRQPDLPFADRTGELRPTDDGAGAEDGGVSARECG